MSLVAGSVTVNPDESVTGTGYARALYDADVATITLQTVPPLNSTSAPYTPARPSNANDINTIKAGRLATLRELARRANAYATATVSYFTTNAVIPATGINDSTSHACTGSAQLT